MIQPGQRLLEQHLATESGVSPIPVREAFRMLGSEGVLVSEPFRGRRVREVGTAELRDLFQIRASLEQLAGELAGEQGVANIDALQTFADQATLAARDKDVPAYAVANRSFHRLIVDAANNARLLTLWDSLQVEIGLGSGSLGNVNLIKSAAEHLLIVEALEQENGMKAGELLRRHIRKIIRSFNRPKRYVVTTLFFSSLHFSPFSGM